MKTLNLVCAGLALFGLIVSTILWRDLHAQRELMAEWQRAHPEAVSANPDRLSHATPASATTPSAQSGAVQARASDAYSGSRHATPSISGQLADERERLKDPEYRKNAVARSRPSIQQSYPGLSEILGLAPDEADRLFDLLAQQQLELNTLPELNLIKGPPGDATEFQDVARLHQETHRRQDESLASLLGNARYGKWQEYQEARRAQQQVLQQYGTAMTALGQPLSEAQVQALASTLVAEEKHRRQDLQGMRSQASPPGSTNPAQLVEEITQLRMEGNKRIVAAARPLLSAAQLESLRATLDKQVAVIRGSVRLGQ